MQQALPQLPAPASADTLLHLPADVEKEVVTKDGINKLKLFHICGTIKPESTLFGTLSFLMFSKGMDLVVGQLCVGQASALSDLLHQSLAIARDKDTFNIRSIAVSLKHI